MDQILIAFGINEIAQLDKYLYKKNASSKGSERRLLHLPRASAILFHLYNYLELNFHYILEFILLGRGNDSTELDGKGSTIEK